VSPFLQPILAPFGRSLAVVAVLAAFVTAPAAQAGPIVFSSGELDLGVGYAGGVWELGWHDEDSGMKYEAGDVIARFLPASIVNRPAGAAFDFLGVGAGQPVYVLPQVQNPAVLFPGIAAEEIDSGIFDNNKVFLELLSIRGPGDFSIWEIDPFGGLNVLLATHMGPFGPLNPLTLSVPSHAHYNWALSQPGLYELDFRAYGFIGGQRSESKVTTFTLDAQAQAQAIPEPATLALFGLVLAPLAVLRRRKHC